MYFLLLNIPCKLGVFSVDKLSNPKNELSDGTINAISTNRPYFAAFLNTPGKEAFHLFLANMHKIVFTWRKEQNGVKNKS